MTTKKTYRRPNTTVVLLAAESALMTISAATSDPTEGGDPTGGDNS
ncbi:MAG: aminotransferase, partial [Prevotella histicola]|nr:aminotransferase [Prevotella histicola]